jgi:hypothetical protein
MTKEATMIYETKPWTAACLAASLVSLMAATVLMFIPGCGDPTTTILSEAEEMGQLAYEAGLRIEANPYSPGWDDHREWVKGWCRAKIQSEAMAAIDARRLAEADKAEKPPSEGTPSNEKGH